MLLEGGMATSLKVTEFVLSSPEVPEIEEVVGVIEVMVGEDLAVLGS